MKKLLFSIALVFGLTTSAMADQGLDQFIQNPNVMIVKELSGQCGPASGIYHFVKLKDKFIRADKTKTDSVPDQKIDCKVALAIAYTNGHEMTFFQTSTGELATFGGTDNLGPGKYSIDVMFMPKNKWPTVNVGNNTPIPVDVNGFRSCQIIKDDSEMGGLACLSEVTNAKKTEKWGMGIAFSIDSVKVIKDTHTPKPQDHEYNYK